MSHQLPELPWSKDALSPSISAETIDYHYGKHHNAYVTKLNAAVDGTTLAEKSLEEIVQSTDLPAGVFNNAAQVWNHTFYWNSLSPDGGGEPTGAIADLINASFGDFNSFKEKFSAAAGGQFGSGWAWLVKNGDGVTIETTSNADTPLAYGKTALLTLDVWEHAYYVDYRNARPDYIAAFWNLVNWDFANSNLG